MTFARYCVLFFLCFSTSLRAQSAPFFPDDNDTTQIIVHNRVLAKVNGQAITVMDVMKKMDVLFYRQFPEYSSVKAARHQFYSTNWKYVLNDLIDKELILADAKEAKMPVSQGDIRQEMEDTFGPNVIQNLDKIGLTMDEAWKMVNNDIIIRRMLGARVNNKALRMVNPQDIRIAYETYAKENYNHPEWIYRVVSIKDSDSTKCAKAAQAAYEIIAQLDIPLDKLEEKIQPELSFSTKVSVSDEFRHKETELSETYKQALLPLAVGAYSKPQLQKSKNDKFTLYRIFYLKEVIPGSVASFTEVAENLKNKMLHEAIEKETVVYLKKMRVHFAVNEEQLKEMIPPGFQPFELKVKR